MSHGDGVARIDWQRVRDRYTTGPSLPSLHGTSSITVLEVDDRRICLGHRLWRDCVSREDLDEAVGLLASGQLASTPMACAEGLRRHYASGHRAETGCTRGPHLTAVVLADLGYLSAA